MEEKELFEDYEIKSFEFSPKMYKIFGAAAFLQLFVFFTVAQFNLLQAKACDSPYVGKVCQVLDAVSLIATDTGFSDQAYTPTEIKELEVTYIDVSRSEPPFVYPEGYFAVANPESSMDSSMMMPSSDFGGSELPYSSSPSELDINKPAILPTPNNSVANQPLPDSPFTFGNEETPQMPPAAPKSARIPSQSSRPPRANRVPSSRQPKVNNQSPSKLPDLGGNAETAKNDNSNANTNQQTAKNETNTNADAAAASEEDKDKFNQRPLKLFGEKYGEQILNKEININAPFTIEVIAKLDANGKLIDPVMRAAEGSDPKMTEVAKEAIAAFSDSKLLRPLYEEGARDVKITFAQNADNLQAIIQTQAKDENAAKKMSSGLNTLVGITKIAKKGSDEAILMEKAQFSSQGRIFRINFLITNDEKNQMIEKSLKNLKQELEQKKTQQPNSVAVSRERDARS